MRLVLTELLPAEVEGTAVKVEVDQHEVNAVDPLTPTTGRLRSPVLCGQHPGSREPVTCGNRSCPTEAISARGGGFRPSHWAGSS